MRIQAVEHEIRADGGALVAIQADKDMNIFVLEAAPDFFLICVSICVLLQLWLGMSVLRQVRQLLQ